MFSGGRQIFQVGQAPSGPTVIRPLLTPAAPSAPCTMNIHYRQAAGRSGYDYIVVHIKYVVN